MNTPDAICLMFDKVRCQQQLSVAGVLVPRSLSPVRTYEALRSQLQANAWKQVFIKPAHSSSASGVIAYRTQGQREQAVTSIEMVNVYGQHRFYNSLRLRRYSSSKDIQPLIDFILQEGAIVEEWIPKATFQHQVFDVRIVVINGKARHVLPRLSAGPITNLHLGNRRGNAELLRQAVGSVKYEQLMHTAEQAVRSIPGAFYAGVDVLIPAGFGQPRVLELNAFGDLLPQLLHQGEDTYTAELKALRYADAI
jgi:glutathione synthase/RimK-type ligase-like ATP-grasp enzyme